MDFWHLMLIGGVVTWTACVFLRAVATRTVQLREQMVPVHPTESEADAATQAAEAAASREPHLAQVMARPKSENDAPRSNGKNGHGKSSGNGHAKIPVKRMSH
jgi:hypothetical protein